MSILNIEETIRFFKSYGFRIDEESVKGWVQEYNKQANTPCESRQVTEDDINRYNDWCFVKGTAYEEGIDDQTKITRLLEEISNLKNELMTVKNENRILEEQLGINPF